ncbi:MAG: diaminopimelate decarboxylase [Oscillospiraceae bacterium]|nr:diaminopimelate decarboxylase [Oscillospiraceae bacterium]
MKGLNNFSALSAGEITGAAESYGTPLYVYDERHIRQRCGECLAIPNAYGVTVRFAMKANSNRTILKTISDAGLHIDASSLNEAIRANLAGVPIENIMLTTQEVHTGSARVKLEQMLKAGMKYNVCSLLQLELICDFAALAGISPGIRIHPGIGSGESATRNTGDDYSCFGVHLSDVAEANELAAAGGIKFRHVHVHIGSGADSIKWQENIDLELDIIEKHFPDALSAGFGGGLKEARMPGEVAADVISLGSYAKERLESFYSRTGRKLHMEIEPGTYIVANSGYTVTRVIDKKRTSRSNFIIIDGGMETNSRPLLYGSRHPVYLVAEDGSQVRSSEFAPMSHTYEAVVAGKCCESGDCQTLDTEGHTTTRAMAEPEIGDLAVIGGTGAYCSSMSPYNYNSHTQIPEVLFTDAGELKLIRKRQTLEQMLENEV